MDVLHASAEILMDRERITREEFEALFNKDHEEHAESEAESASEETAEDTDAAVSEDKTSSEETESSDK